MIAGLSGGSRFGLALVPEGGGRNGSGGKLERCKVRLSMQGKLANCRQCKEERFSSLEDEDDQILVEGLLNCDSAWL